MKKKTIYSSIKILLFRCKACTQKNSKTSLHIPSNGYRTHGVCDRARRIVRRPRKDTGRTHYNIRPICKYTLILALLLDISQSDILKKTKYASPKDDINGSTHTGNPDDSNLRSHKRAWTDASAGPREADAPHAKYIQHIGRDAHAQRNPIII